jgi:hypothetical protein
MYYFHVGLSHEPITLAPYCMFMLHVLQGLGETETRGVALSCGASMSESN